METTTYAQALLEASGGAGNIRELAMCMTRLRLDLYDVKLASLDDIRAIHHVLSVRPRGASGVEVVFGPAIVNTVAEELATLIARPITRRNAKAVVHLTPAGPRRMRSDRADVHLFKWDGGAVDDGSQLTSDDLEHLREILNSVDFNAGDESEAEGEEEGLGEAAVLVLNGPNMNLLGLREPGIYGDETYDDLVRLCHETAQEEGFDEVRCYQSNHEGDLVDAIQEARFAFDGIVLNPAAYTHTSVAILDALKAVGLPCVEVHVSAVNEREDFRQISYVRSYCIACVAGEGLQGYAHAIRILADHLRAKRA